MSDLNQPGEPDGIQGDEPAGDDEVPAPEVEPDEDATGPGPVPPPPD